MRAAIWTTWTLAVLVVTGGVAAFVGAYRPSSASAAGRQAQRYAADRAADGAVVGAGIGFVVAGLAGFALKRRRPSATRPTAPALPPTTIEALAADVVHEVLIDLRRQLRRLTDAKEPDMVAFVDAMLTGAVRIGASDVHLHPLAAGTDIAFRVQGVLHEVMTCPRHHHKQLVARLKVMARLITFRADQPQDGHFVLTVAGNPVDFRISVLPTNHGERAVLRVANIGLALPDLGALGLPERLLERYRMMLTRPQGIVFLTGPTGSGKTTTIYGSLAHIKRSRGETTQIATIEDPIEFDVPFLTQTQVKPDVGLTFAAGLRSILRQDPNVIMVGEIRDGETAHIAVQAGLTGHQIVTTVHADSAAGVFNRLIEMGVEPFLLASASLACLSQRQVRSLCPHCRVLEPPSSDERLRLELAGIADEQFYAPRGCPKCDRTGYLGRTAIYELLEVTPAIRELVNAKVPTPRIHAAAEGQGMVPLLHAGIERVRTGATSLREVLRVCG
ncbi:MAG: type II/IV secretion system protein [Myxococcales bacterium]|nr:type II/IV secretion system protein [Myxococcales bacterium]